MIDAEGVEELGVFTLDNKHRARESQAGQQPARTS